MRTAYGPLARDRTHSQIDRSVAILDAHWRSIEEEFDVVIPKDLSYLLGHIAILMLQQLRPALDDRHVAAETPEHLGEFEADITSAEHEQMLGQIVQIHNRRRIKHVHLIDPFDLGDGRTSAGVDED